jgi:purine-nucleoside phosphorylase
MSSPLEKHLADSLAFLNAPPPKVAVILGSGWGSWAESLPIAREIAYADIPHFAPTTVDGHSGRLLLTDNGIALLQGRFHGYEGHSPQTVVYPVRLMARWGVQTLIITNAAGGIRSDLGAGDVLILKDHLNLSGQNPLTGPNVLGGPRFPDLKDAYTPRLRDIAKASGQAMGWTLTEGVYAGVSGPTYETPAEVGMFRTLGADAVGMSTVWEVIAAAHLGLPVLALSCIANKAVDLTDEEPLTHEQVLAAVQAAGPRLSALLSGIVRLLPGF